MLRRSGLAGEGPGIGGCRVGQERAMPDQKFSDGKVAISSFNNNFELLIITLVSLVQCVI